VLHSVAIDYSHCCKQLFILSDEFKLGLGKCYEKVGLVSEKLSKICVLIDELKELGVEINSDDISVNMDKLIDFQT
tara:strand:- start:281 stop:508 length:228 start_codon:yes stop_codon:yes gene_type:complete